MTMRTPYAIKTLIPTFGFLGFFLMGEDNDTGEFDDLEATVLSQSPSPKPEDFSAGLSPRELAHILQGEVLGHFHLQKFIGGGGMGVVFKALDTTLERIVAVKVVASTSVSDEDLQRRFLVEAQSTARLDHPNIARVHLVGRDRGLPYIVFEYIDGVNLRDLVSNQGPLPLAHALGITCQIALALDHAWQRDVVHRDIKPSNILISRDRQAKLVDMGLARLTQVESPERDLTNTGVTLGTFDYISPEQARDARLADTRSDIYSLGCTLFYMLVGRPPFSEGTAVQKLLKHQRNRPPDIRQIRGDVPESVNSLVQRMLAKQADDRTQTPAKLVEELTQICQDVGVALPQTLAPLSVLAREHQRSNWRRHAPWVFPVVALLLFANWRTASDSWNASEFQFPPFRPPSAEGLTSHPEKPVSDNEGLELSDSANDSSTASPPVPFKFERTESMPLEVGSILDESWPSDSTLFPYVATNLPPEGILYPEEKQSDGTNFRFLDEADEDIER